MVVAGAALVSVASRITVAGATTVTPAVTTAVAVAVALMPAVAVTGAVAVAVGFPAPVDEELVEGVNDQRTVSVTDLLDWDEGDHVFIIPWCSVRCMKVAKVLAGEAADDAIY